MTRFLNSVVSFYAARSRYQVTQHGLFLCLPYWQGDDVCVYFMVYIEQCFPRASITQCIRVDFPLPYLMVVQLCPRSSICKEVFSKTMAEVLSSVKLASSFLTIVGFTPVTLTKIPLSLSN